MTTSKGEEKGQDRDREICGERTGEDHGHQILPAGDVHAHAIVTAVANVTATTTETEVDGDTAIRTAIGNIEESLPTQENRDLVGGDTRMTCPMATVRQLASVVPCAVAGPSHRKPIPSPLSGVIQTSRPSRRRSPTLETRVSLLPLPTQYNRPMAAPSPSNTTSRPRRANRRPETIGGYSSSRGKMLSILFTSVHGVAGSWGARWPSSTCRLSTRA